MSSKDNPDKARPRSSSVSELIKSYENSDTPAAKVTVSKRQADIKAYFSKTGKELLRATGEVIGLRPRKSNTDTTSLSSQPSQADQSFSSTTSDPQKDTVFMDTASELQPSPQPLDPKNPRGQKRGPAPATSSVDNSPVKKESRIEPAPMMETQVQDLNTKVAALTQLNQHLLQKYTELETQMIKIRSDAVDDKADLMTTCHNLQAHLTRIDETLSVHDLLLSKHEKAFQMLDRDAGTNISGAVTQLTAVQEELANNKTMLATMEALMKGLKLSGNNNRNSRGLYIAGLDKIKAHFQLRPHTHPVEAVKTLLWYAKCFSQYKTIVPLEKHKHWSEVRSALIFCHSAQNKKDLEMALKKFFQHTNTKGVLLRDIFPSDKIQEAKDLTKIAATLKDKGEILKFRVVNKSDRPVLQVLPNIPNTKGYVDYKADETSSMDTGPATGANATPIGQLALQNSSVCTGQTHSAPSSLNTATSNNNIYDTTKVPDGYPPLPPPLNPTSASSSNGVPTPGPSSSSMPTNPSAENPGYAHPPWFLGGHRNNNGIPA